MDATQKGTKSAERAAAVGRPTLLAATDGSEASLHAGERAVGLAGFIGAKLYVLYVVDEDEAFRAGIHYGEASKELAAFDKQATGRIAELAQRAGVEYEEVVTAGDPARTILAVAEDVGADYVLMGAEGASRLSNALFGSVSEEVLRRADRTVLLVGGKRAQTDPLLDRLERMHSGA
jgi:nucleotide-binding universal stress UspA family protein